MSEESATNSCNHNTLPKTRNSPSVQEEPEPPGRVVTDAVHERFRQKYVFCDVCRTKIIGNELSIHNHFNALHPSDEHCVYCKGKVHRYYDICKDNEKPKEFIFHKCSKYSGCVPDWGRCTSLVFTGADEQRKHLSSRGVEIFSENGNSNIQHRCHQNL
ncbi:uncharacterized protein LOC117181336 isoform X2 [Belonocnema kinseyi]|nr:uncharacterized protein LOC117181336 isoform X2 [Belonocnema kinseyi]XP_033229794.1 uncharacterized protein LOC117181336 isoform X2 [Belonocnema kinseyi]